MNWAHIHLLLSHLPVWGCIFGLFLLFLSMMRGSRELLVGTLWLFLLSALATIPAYISGGSATPFVEHLPGVTAPLIDQHREVAAFSLAVTETLGLLSLLSLIQIRRNRTISRWLGSLTLVLAVTAAISLGWTANLGGLIRHTEIRADQPAPPVSHPASPE